MAAAPGACGPCARAPAPRRGASPGSLPRWRWRPRYVPLGTPPSAAAVLAAARSEAWDVVVASSVLLLGWGSDGRRRGRGAGWTDCCAWTCGRWASWGWGTSVRWAGGKRGACRRVTARHSARPGADQSRLPRSYALHADGILERIAARPVHPAALLAPASLIGVAGLAANLAGHELWFLLLRSRHLVVRGER